MKALLVFFVIFYIFSCNKEISYEERYKTCVNKLELNNMSTQDQQLQSRLNVYDCMKGANSPEISSTTVDGSIINTKPSENKAIIIYCWSIPDKNSPIDFVSSDNEDMQAVNELAHTYSNDIKFIGFSSDDSTSVVDYINKNNIKFPQVSDAIDICKNKFLTNLHFPFIMFINKKGKITKIFSGSYRKKNKIKQKYIPIINACLSNQFYYE